MEARPTRKEEPRDQGLRAPDMVRTHAQEPLLQDRAVRTTVEDLGVIVSKRDPTVTFDGPNGELERHLYDSGGPGSADQQQVSV